MRRHATRFGLLSLLAFCLFLLPGTDRAADAGFSIAPFPFFTPITDCGTIDTVPGFYDVDGDGQPDDCTVWIADSGGAFIFNGVDSFNDGDRVFVDGLICNTCLTTCPAGAILSAKTASCP